jgi:outer membrane immunogenic protein
MEDRMKKLLLAGAAVSALLAGSSSAADLARPAPVYIPPPPVVALFTWTGCYVGGNVGGVWASREWTAQTPGSPIFGISSGSNNASGAIGGVQVGCNYQVGAWVFGIQGDYDWSNANTTRTGPFVALPTFGTYDKLKSLASVTGRVGYAFDRFLGYVKAGGAWEQSDYNLVVAGLTAASVSETKGGWTVGVGGEYAFLNWLTGFIEYDYYSFGNNGNAFVCGVAACGLPALVAPAVLVPPTAFNIKTNVNVLKVGLNLKFP